MLFISIPFLSLLKIKTMVKRIDVTEKALEIIKTLKEKHGDLMFYQAGGCCEGTQPQCFEKGEFYLRTNDVMICLVDNFEFWLDRDLFEYLKFSHFTLDIVDGFGPGGFSLETPLGKTFKIEYRLFTEDELNDLEPIKRME